MAARDARARGITLVTETTTRIALPAGLPDALDRPVWSCLRGAWAHLAQSHGEAVRLDPAYGPFAAAERGAEAALLHLLESPDDRIWLVEPAAVAPPAGMCVIRTAPLVQMVADGDFAPQADDADIVALDERDRAEMAALALAMQPGPWAARTADLGPFHGIRRDGRLAAMAGERMRPAPGLGEVSGVCTWPEFQGQGLARRLIRRVLAGQHRRGDLPFLHSYAGNAHAIALYESLGFRVRRDLVVTVLGRAA